jgi:hypothetical protein
MCDDERQSFDFNRDIISTTLHLEPSDNNYKGLYTIYNFRKFKLQMAVDTETGLWFHAYLSVLDDTTSILSLSMDKDEFLTVMTLAHSDEHAAFDYMLNIAGYTTGDTL